ncbi:hypothetical protein [Nocardia neocaledoniensis]|uniref:hypothetical protein n=1 Tax=Nocardia neocaledoniensis TaxID=236511 RepID=UPI00245492E8|nr:hypothetical protein [Nocardia neocaledoniensis]
MNAVVMATSAIPIKMLVIAVMEATTASGGAEQAWQRAPPGRHGRYWPPVVVCLAAVLPNAAAVPTPAVVRRSCEFVRAAAEPVAQFALGR